jgi:ribosomal protein S21
MNKTKTLSSLYNIANVLDNSGLYKEANTITQVMVRIAEEDNSKVDKAIERFKRSCEMITNSERTKQEKRTERMISRYEISQNLSGEDLEKFDKAANNISVD